MRAAVMVVALGLLLGGCGGSPEVSSPRLLTALCDAVAAPPAEAARIFDRDAHRPLHELAEGTAEHDRRVAGRLLRAKNAVEAAAAQPDEELHRHLAELVAATRDALVALGSPAPACPTGEDQR